MNKSLIAIFVIAFLSIGCGGLTVVQPIPTLTIPPTWTTGPLPTQTITGTVPPALSPTETFTLIPTETLPPTFTPEPTLTPVPQWVIQGPGDVVAPILLYHHIGTSPSNNPYYVSAYAFEQQMFLLHEWGYQTISVELLIHAIKDGASLPPRPIILTFDDGSDSVYSAALPILKKYGFTGTAYIVYNYIGLTNDFMDAGQIRELYAAGWEIGSHSISHVDLTERTDRQQDEIVDSRIKLQKRLNLPILTFAYPFGTYDKDSLHYAHFAGYIGAVGLGNSSLQGSKNLFYLYRMDIQSTEDLYSLAARLPWRNDLDTLPILTIVP